jgi:transcriptional regulator with XRE-family HTH domain
MQPSYRKYAAVRDQKGMTDYEVATKSGVASATLSSWKNGKYFPKIDKLASIAQCLGVMIEELLEKTN